MPSSILGARSVNICFNFDLILICLACYALLIIVFLTPASLHLESLVVVQSGKLQPTVAVSLLAALLVASTSALATRCVEQSLWLKLAPRTIRRRITAHESHRLAQWSVSPLARLTYFVSGSSWLLKLGGVMLISGAVLSPVLLVGVTQRDATSISNVIKINDTALFAGFLDPSNMYYNGGSFSDVPTTIASLAIIFFRATWASACDASTAHRREYMLHPRCRHPNVRPVHFAG
jgi:hypothetical protein